MRRYIFTTNHRIVGLQFFWLSLFAVTIGIVLSLLMRFHLANPSANVAWFEKIWPTGAAGGVMTPELYLALMTMHGTLMVFFVLSVAPQSAFGNYFLPLQIGAKQMAHPSLTGLSFWMTAIAFLLMLATFFVPGGPPISGWTAYTPLSAVGVVSGPGEGFGQTLWIVSIGMFCVAAILGSANFIATILEHRADGVRMMQLPLTCWNWFVTAILSLLGFPVLLAAAFLLLLDRHAGTSFFVPGGLLMSDHAIAHQGGAPLLWQHLFWFFGHPEVYIAILPGMGLVSEILSTFSRKPVFGYRGMVLATFAIGFLGLLVWGHHMFVSGMSPYSSIAFSVLSMTIGVPSAVKTFNWLATIWGGHIYLTTAMLFALGFVSVFVTGGLSGIFVGQPLLDLYLHDTYFVVAHFHLIMGVAAILGIFAGIFYWFPLMFGRMLDERLGKIHFVATFIGVYALFLPMHLAGVAGNPRRYSDFTNFDFLAPLLPLHRFMSWAAFFTAAAQIIFFVNLFWSMRRRKLAPANPWNALTREWNLADVPGASELEKKPRLLTSRTPGFTVLFALLAALAMFFAALASAYVVRRGLSNDWVAIHPPLLVWMTPGLFVLSGTFLWAGRKSLNDHKTRARVWLSGLITGILFLLTILYTWKTVWSTGLSFIASPATAFFLIFTGAFGLLAALCVVVLIASVLRMYAHSPMVFTNGTKAVLISWNFLGILWVYLLALMFMWR